MTWKVFQKSYRPEPVEYFAGAQALGLQCPLDVFEQLFIDHHDEADFAEVVRFVDWSAIEWTEKRVSGVALRRCGVPRVYQFAVDEARARTVEKGFQDERTEVMHRWQEAKSWLRSPIILAGSLLQTTLQYELIVGFTRLGEFLGALDRQDLPESGLHTIWLGH